MGYFTVPDVLVTVIAYLHIISAMGWLGGAILFTSALTPGVRRMSQAANIEFFAIVVPRLTRYFLIVVFSTVIFGPLLFLTIPDESPLIYGGIAAGLTAFLLVLSEVPVFRRLTSMAQEMLKSGHSGPPPAEYVKALRRAGISTVATVVLLVVALMFMVYSGYPF